ncbi:MAG: tryptophan synthase subunit alpha [Bacteroidales bacterium]
MNKTGKYLQAKKDILSMYILPDFPNKGNLKETILSLQNAGVDMFEIGVPFSDPLADGPTIQQFSQQALANGFSISQLFDDIEHIKKDLKIPLAIMSYINSLIAYGMDKFLERCKSISIDSVILPDMTPYIYKTRYKDKFEKAGISPVFLITPQSKDEKIKEIASLSKSFIYAVSQNSTTGSMSGNFNEDTIKYFKRLKRECVDVPILVGFGINNKTTFDQACAELDGAIIGSAFLKAQEKGHSAKEFVGMLRG